MHSRTILRAEGGALFVAALAAFLSYDGRLWLLLALALAPDLSMLGYRLGPRRGSYVYNAAHTYVPPLALAGIGLLVAAPLAVAAALVWIGHIGADRAVGYGLKSPSSFDDTHLDPAPAEPSEGSAVAGPDPTDHAGTR